MLLHQLFARKQKCSRNNRPSGTNLPSGSPEEVVEYFGNIVLLRIEKIVTTQLSYIKTVSAFPKNLAVPTKALIKRWLRYSDPGKKCITLGKHYPETHSNIGRWNWN
jgi:hypothetical protein